MFIYSLTVTRDLNLGLEQRMIVDSGLLGVSFLMILQNVQPPVRHLLAV